MCAICRRVLGLPTQRRPRQGGKMRWQHLWERHRRGLVKQRIEAEHDETVVRIRELQPVQEHSEQVLPDDGR